MCSCTGPEESGSGPGPTEYPEPSGYPDPGYPIPTYRKRQAEGVPPQCVYYTTTVWTTTTVENTETIHVPTTYYEVSTDVQISVSTDRVTEVSTYSTITTLTTTYTYTSLVPTTVVSDHTEYLTETFTSVSTFTEEVLVTETVTSGFTATQSVTLPPATVTLPPDTVTLPASTITTTLDGEEVTITLPGTTLPGEIVTTTFTETQPPSTVTITEDGEVITSVLPGTTSIVTTTIVIPREPVTACPAPTNIPGVNPDIPFDPLSNRTFGCEPGFVCNPPKPQGCNLWADSPADDYVCKPKYCIPSPPYSVVKWPEGETGYVPPDEGYFNLNPNAFGLPFSIFEYETYIVQKYGKQFTLTTGNWASATELSVFPPLPTQHVARAALPPRQDKLDKRQDLESGVTPAAVCFDDCNNCYKEAQAVGKGPTLCAEGSQFLANYGICMTCIEQNAEDQLDTRRRYPVERFSQFINYCEGQDTDPISSSSAATSAATSLPPAESAVTSDPADVETTSQQPVESNTSPEPIPSPSTTTTSEAEEPSESSDAAPTSAQSSVLTPTSTVEAIPQPTSSETDSDDGVGVTASPSAPAETEEPTSTDISPTNSAIPGEGDGEDGDDDGDDDETDAQPSDVAEETDPPSSASESQIPSISLPLPPGSSESEAGFPPSGASSLERSGLWTLMAPLLALFLV